MLYSQTYMLVQQSALVRADFPLRSVNELDRPGQVIGVNTDERWRLAEAAADGSEGAGDARLHVAGCGAVASER